MRARYLDRLLVHVLAILSAIACWWLLADFALALCASLLVFLLVSGIGHVAFGPMPTAEDLRRDVMRMLQRPE